MTCFTELNRNVNKTKKDCQLILFLNEPTVLFVCVAYLFYFHSVNGYKYPASNAAYSDILLGKLYPNTQRQYKI